MNCEPDNLSRKGTIVFLAANASYSHTNLAGWYLRNYAVAAGWEWREVEVVQTDSLATALQKVLGLKPDVLAASFYLFNANYLLSFITRFKALKPDCLVIGGGPEFLGDNFSFLSRHPEINVVIRGAGETAFAAWLECWRDPEQWGKISGLCAFIDGKYVDNGKAEAEKNLNDIPSPYERNLNTFKKPFLLLETSRGCSNKCAFCTSAGEHVRFFSVARVRRDLSLIAAGGVREVRIADRTFNENLPRFMALIKIMRDEFKDIRFHLEIDPARLSDEMVRELSAAEPGKFHPPSPGTPESSHGNEWLRRIPQRNMLHLEVGLQTTRSEALRRIGRAGSVERALAVLDQLCSRRNLSVHVDLMAGLPGTGLADLYADLRTVALLQPDEIQLELLKVLPGTRLRENMEKFGIIASGKPPYEILQTSTMSHDDLVIARHLSNLVDWFYNTPELQQSFLEAVRLVPDFLERFVGFSGGLTGAVQRPTLENRFRLLEQFCRLNAPALIPALGYAWLKWGLSAQHGICPAIQWKKPLPKDAVLVEGDVRAAHRRIYLAELERPYLFVYGHGPCRRPCAVYVLKNASSANEG